MSQADSIVHIGYHKTATTWFQTRLYPLVASHDYIPRKGVRSAFLYAHAFKFDPQAVRAQLGLDQERPAILCEEELSGSFQTGGHMGALSKDIAERIHGVLPEARIVVFIRNQVDMVAAAYAQYVKRGGTHRPERLLFPGNYRKGPWRRPYKKPLFSFDPFEYVGLTLTPCAVALQSIPDPTAGFNSSRQLHVVFRARFMVPRPGTNRVRVSSWREGAGIWEVYT